MADLHSVSAEQKRYLQIQKRNVRLIQCFRILLLIHFSGIMGNNCPTGHHRLFYLFQSFTDFRYYV